MIAHWPMGIKPQSKPIETPRHVVDVVPTILELAVFSNQKTQGARVEPVEDASRQPPAFAGVSFLEEIKQDAAQSTGEKSERPLWWQHEGNRALRWGEWKIVAAGKDAQWELYNMNDDRSETIDLANLHADVVDRLSKKWSELTEQFTKDAISER
jgi:arylsulfatase